MAHVRKTLAAAALAGGLILSSALGPATHAAPVRTVRTGWQHCMLWGGGELEVIQAGYTFDGSHAWVNWENTNGSWYAFPTTGVNKTWEGVYNNGAGGIGYTDAGVDYTVSFGIPTPWGGINTFTGSSAIRLRIYPSGQTRCLFY